MKVYHLSTDIFNSIKEFKPRVPKSIMAGENNTINRICVGLSIIDCLNGLEYSAFNRDMFTDNNDCYDFIKGYRSLKVYEFNCSFNELLTPDKLKLYVPDALKTKECWLTRKIKPINEYIIDIKSIEEDIDKIKYVDYSKVTIDNYYKKAYILLNNNDINAIYEDIKSLITINSRIINNKIELDIKDFPMIKNNMYCTLNNFLSWIEHDIIFI